MGKPGLTADRSASGAMVNKIIRRVPVLYERRYVHRAAMGKTRQTTNSDFMVMRLSTVHSCH